MSRWSTWGLGIGALLVAGAPLHGAEDVSGSSDPAGIERYPRSWIVEYEEQPASPYQFVTAPVDRIKREVRVEAVRVQGPAAPHHLSHAGPDPAGRRHRAL